MEKEQIDNLDKDYEFDAIIVGAGPGGSAIGALLAKKGWKVLLVDKNPRAGGRMMTIHEGGFHYELFPLNGVPKHNSHFERILQEIGKENEVETIYPENIGNIYYETKKGEIRQWNTNSSFLGMLKLFGVRIWNLKKLYQTLKVFAKLARMPSEEIEKLYDVSAMDYINQFSLPIGIYTYILATFGEGVFEMPSDKTSAAEMVKIFQHVKKDGGGRYYKNGIGYVFEVFAKTVQDLGGTTLFNTRVERINVEKGLVTGITTKDGTQYHAPIIVSNSGLRQTVLKLIGEDQYSEDYVDWIKGLEHNLACVGFRWFIDKPILSYPTYVLYPEGCVSTYLDFEAMAAGKKRPEHAYIYLGTTSVYPGLAPEGKQLIYACMSCLADPDIDITPYLEYVEKKVKQIFPEIFNHIEKVQTFGPKNVPGVGTDIVLPHQGGESYGLALSVGQTGKKQPKGDSPIKGLFHVGCDAGGSGLGTHQALDSALNVLNLVLGY